MPLEPRTNVHIPTLCLTSHSISIVAGFTQKAIASERNDESIIFWDVPHLFGDSVYFGPSWIQSDAFGKHGNEMIVTFFGQKGTCFP